VTVPHERVNGYGIEDRLHRRPSIEKSRRAIGWEPTRDRGSILLDVIESRRGAPARIEPDELSVGDRA
jgi:hypothetical protein